MSSFNMCAIIYHYIIILSSTFFCNYKRFSIKSSVVDLPVIQMEAVDLLIMCAIEPSTCGAGFYANVFMMPKCMYCLSPMLNPKWLVNCYMHIRTYIHTYLLPSR